MSSLPRCMEGLEWGWLNQLSRELFNENSDSYWDCLFSEFIQTAAETSLVGVNQNDMILHSFPWGRHWFSWGLFRIGFLEPLCVAAAWDSISVCLFIASTSSFVAVVFPFPSVRCPAVWGEGVLESGGGFASPDVAQREVRVGGTCLLPAGRCCWMLTSYGFRLTARISLQLPVVEAKSVPILSAPCHLQVLGNKQQTNKCIRIMWTPEWRKLHIIIVSNGSFKAGSGVSIISGKETLKKKKKLN